MCERAYYKTRKTGTQSNGTQNGTSTLVIMVNGRIVETENLKKVLDAISKIKKRKKVNMKKKSYRYV